MKKTQPQKFTFDLRDCEPGITICRPKPIAFKMLQDSSDKHSDDEESCTDSAHDEADDEDDYLCDEFDDPEQESEYDDDSETGSECMELECMDNQEER